ncbi:MAG: hypothetical protein NTY02_16100 [Acidobacteria bacterium]|nr:hypothetical protein [Acidobacteriota bacterium]
MTLAHADRRDPVPGLVAALLVFCIYGGFALSVDVSRTAFGIQSDEATYYMMGHSLADDGDLAYRRDDLARVWREFSAGPSGVFLKKGRSLDMRVDGRPPFIHLDSTVDSDAGRLYFGKSYIYPLFAAPFVAVFGTNGFFVFHAMLLGVMLFAAYTFLNARSSPLVSLILASGFFMASVAPAYYAWMTPELFNLCLVVLGYFCWLYKEVASPEQPFPGSRWLFSGRSDLAAAILLGVATFSKPSNLLLILPMLAWLVARRHWRRMVAAGAIFAVVGGVLVAGNLAVTGDWNFQGGERRTFYGPYPFENQQVQWGSSGASSATTWRTS